MGDVTQEQAYKLVEEFVQNYEKYIANPEEDVSESLVWALWKLALTGDDDDLVDQGYLMALKLFHTVPPLFQSSFIYQLYLLSSFPVISLLTQIAAKNGIPFPSHLLVEASYNIGYKTGVSQHIMGMGSNSMYNLGVTSDSEVKEPRMIQVPRTVKKVKMSNTHTLFLTEDGSVYGCGQGNAGQLGPNLRRVIVTPSVVLQAEDKCTVVDIAVGEGFSALITSNKEILILGKYGKLEMDKQGLHKFKTNETRLLAISVEKGEIFVRCKETMFKCGPDNMEFKESREKSSGIPQTSRSRISTVSQAGQMELYPLEGNPDEKLPPVLKDRFSRRKADNKEFGSNLIGILQCSNAAIKIYTDVIYTINGLMVNLTVRSVSVTRDGQVKLIASTHGTGKGADSLSWCLFTGKACIVAEEDTESDFRFVPAGDQQTNFRVVFVLEELPASHGVNSFEISPDGKNMIYVFDKDQDYVDRMHQRYHRLHFLSYEDRSDPKKAVVKLAIPQERKGVLDLEALNVTALEDYMDPIPFDVYVPVRVNHNVSEVCKPNGRLDFLKGMYPPVTEMIKDGVVCLDKKYATPREKTIRDFLLLCFLNRIDIIPPDALEHLYVEMQKTYRNTKAKNLFDDDPVQYEEEVCRLNIWVVSQSNTLDRTPVKRLFNEFLAEYLGEIGLTAQEILPNKYLLRSIYADFYVDHLTTNMVVCSKEGERFPFHWELLLLQSPYFRAAMHHSDTDSNLTWQYPSKIVGYALRVFLEPNYLYDLEYDELFELVDLWDSYICDAALNDTLEVIFELATEGNAHLLFDLYLNMAHLQERLLPMFMGRLHMLLYWKAQHRAPLKLLEDVEHQITQKLFKGIGMHSDRLYTANPFMRGVCFDGNFGCLAKIISRTINNDPSRYNEINWARLPFPETKNLLLTNQWTVKLSDQNSQKVSGCFVAFFKEARVMLGFYELSVAPNDVRPFHCGAGGRHGFDTEPNLCSNLIKSREKSDHHKKKRVKTNSFNLESSGSRNRVNSESKTTGRKLQTRSQRPDLGVDRNLEPEEYPVEFASRPGENHPDLQMEAMQLGEDIQEKIAMTEEFNRLHQLEFSLGAPGPRRPSPHMVHPPLKQKEDPNFPQLSPSGSKPVEKAKFNVPKGTKFKPVDLSIPKKAAIAPWAAAEPSSSNNGNPSFKEIQEEEAVQAKKMAPAAKPLPVGIPQQRMRKNTWHDDPTSASPSSPAVSFAAIMAEEHRRQNPEKKPAKPLTAVATEERAMQELAQMYGLQYDGEAVVTVGLAD